MVPDFRYDFVFTTVFVSCSAFLAAAEFNVSPYKGETQMKKKLTLITFIIIIGITFFSGCMNMPTPTAQITGSYTSGLNYKNFTCEELAAELASLARRENQLVIAQEQRIKTSEVQAFWWGYGRGDGVEASELANVRGEKEAVRKAMESKGCKQ